MYLETLKRCGKCKEWKSLSEFGKSSSNKDGLRNTCRECRKKYNQAHRVKKAEYNKEYLRIHGTKIREGQKKYRQTEHGKLMCRKGDLKKSFGITLEDFDKMVENQNGVCAICGNINIKGHKLCVDHNHETGEIRALLCDHCNHLLGCAKENIIVLQSAINYLHDYSSLKSK